MNIYLFLHRSGTHFVVAPDIGKATRGMTLHEEWTHEEEKVVTTFYPLLPLPKSGHIGALTITAYNRAKEDVYEVYEFPYRKGVVYCE